MCLISTDKQCSVADRPVPCYKVVRRKRFDGVTDKCEFTSKHVGFTYEIGKEYALDETGRERFPDENGRWAVHVKEGFHSYRNESDADFLCADDEVLLLCEIPAGSRYWEGNIRGNGEYSELCAERIAVKGWRFQHEKEWKAEPAR